MKLTASKVHIRATFRDGHSTTIEESLTFSEHLEESRKIKDIVFIETLDGSIFQTV